MVIAQAQEWIYKQVPITQEWTGKEVAEVASSSLPHSSTSVRTNTLVLVVVVSGQAWTDAQVTMVVAAFPDCKDKQAVVSDD